MAWLFAKYSAHMKKLARDILDQGGIYEPPLVFPAKDRFIIYDGNRRTTCLKLISAPNRAPSTELQDYFRTLQDSWTGQVPTNVTCRVETDRDKIDEILFRRHTGSQGGVGQSNWDGRMKTTFVNRTGKGTGLNLADEIQDRLKEADLVPAQLRIPRTNLNRLLSSEVFRNRVGISCDGGKFHFIRQEEVALKSLARIARDLAEKKITLNEIWDAESKRRYLDRLDSQGLLPSVADAIAPIDKTEKSSRKKFTKKVAPQPKRRARLIPHHDFEVAWTGSLQRQKAIWEELQFSLELEQHPNAIAVLCRVLLELSVDNYIRRAGLTSAVEGDALLKKLNACAEDLHANSQIDKRYLQVIRKAGNMDAVISIDTLNKYVHSSQLAPSPNDLLAIWDTFAELIVRCLNK